MRIPLLFALGLSLVWATAMASGDDKVPEPSKASYVKVRVEVEVRGILSYAEKGIRISSRFKVFDLESVDKEGSEGGEKCVYDLDFARAKDLRKLAKELNSKEVLVVGMSELRMAKRALLPGMRGSPPPTWELHNTVLVTSLKAIGQK